MAATTTATGASTSPASGSAPRSRGRSTAVARALYKSNSGPTGFPRASADVRRALGGLFRDGTPVTEGGDGYNPTVATARRAPFMFAGNPAQASYWSMLNANGAGTALPPDDLRMLAASGAISLAPGASAEYTVAILWARGANNFDSAARLIALARGFATSVPAEPEAAVPDGLMLRVGPNPAGARATVAYRLPAPGRVRLAVYDLLGREVALLADGDLAVGAHEATLDARPLPAGAYFIRLATEQGVVTRSLIRVR